MNAATLRLIIAAISLIEKLGPEAVKLVKAWTDGDVTIEDIKRQAKELEEIDVDGLLDGVKTGPIG
jgi:hypothetical protein